MMLPFVFVRGFCDSRVVFDAVCRSTVDLAFVLDSSGSIDDIDSNAWTLMLNFVTDVVRQFQVDLSTAHIGLIRYSNDAEIIFRLNFNELVLLLSAVRDV